MDGERVTTHASVVALEGIGVGAVAVAVVAASHNDKPGLGAEGEKEICVSRPWGSR